jgi:hypothetical protein
MPDQKSQKGLTSLVGVGPLTTLPSGAPFLEEAVFAWSQFKPNVTRSEFEILDITTGPTVEVEIVLHDGRPEVDEVKVSRRAGDPEIDAKFLREIPLGQIAESAVVQMELWARREWAETSADSPGPIGPDVSHPYWKPVTESVAARRRRSVTDELLREVAAVYQADTTGKPTKAVKEHFPTSQRNAARYVALAKERGFINQTEDQS